MNLQEVELFKELLEMREGLQRLCEELLEEVFPDHRGIKYSLRTYTDSFTDTRMIPDVEFFKDFDTRRKNGRKYMQTVKENRNE